MIPKAEDEKLIRLYLLGELTEDDRRRLETRVFDDEEFAARFPEHLSLLEDELIEDYVKGALTPREKNHFEDHFLRTPQRREKLSFVESLSKYATDVWARATMRFVNRIIVYTAGWRLYLPPPGSSPVALF